MNVKDRHESNSLHALGSGSGLMQHRDASGSTSTGKGKWNKSPTIIATPSNSSRTQDPFNPYTNRLGSNLGLKRAPGNPTANQTVLGGTNYYPLTLQPMDTRPGKRAKLDPTNHHIGGMQRSTRSRHFPNNSDRKGKAPEPIIVDDDEDLGIAIGPQKEVSSPDPLLGNFENTHKTLPIYEQDPYPFKMLGGSKREVHKRRSVNVSEHTNALKLELKATKQDEPVYVDDSDDPIEDSPAESATKNIREPSPGRNSIRPGTVKGKALALESVPAVPHIDFRTQLVAGSVKNGMKGKSSSKKPPSSKGAGQAGQRDPIATSSSNYTRNAQSSSVLSVSIEKWTLGFEMFPKQDDLCRSYYLHWDTKARKKKLTIKQAYYASTFILEIDVNMCIESLAYCQDAENPFMQLTFFKDAKVTGPAFNPGSSGDDGKMTFKFRRGPIFSADTYQMLIAGLQAPLTKKETLLPVAAKACWERAENAVAMGLQQASRKASESDGGLVRKRSERVQKLRDGSSAQSGPSSTRQSTRKAQAPKDVSLDLPEIVPTERPKPRPAYKGVENGADPSEPSRRSARQSAMQSKAASPSLDLDELILVYPPSGTGAINITRADLGRLEPGEFLNDTLIEFGLKLWLNDLRELHPDLADQIHVFSSFFYKKLNNKKLEEGYQSVRKWTSKFDLFQKKYIIVPINEHLHWYLAIIYQPEHILAPPPPKEPVSSISTRTRTRLSDVPLPVDESHDTSTTSSTSRTSPLPDKVLDQSTSEPLSETQCEAEVENLLEACSIGQLDYNGKPVSSASSASKRLSSARDSPEPIAVDPDDGNSSDFQLRYPTSPFLEPSRSDMDVEPDVEKIRDQSPSGRYSPTLSETARSEYNAVGPASFYSSAPDKGKRKAEQSPLDLDESNDEVGQIDDSLLIPDPDDEKPGPEDHTTTYIFTLDSLGSRHPQALKILKQYLKMEAKDKKGIEETTEAVGKQAMVPVQPNYCDCGIYLLHFAQTFMTDPEKYCRIINNRKTGSKIPHEARQADWNDAAISTFREVLAERVRGLSGVWKIGRGKRTEETEKEKEASEDDDVVIEETPPPPPPKEKEPVRGKKGKERKSAEEDGPAARMRG